MVPLTTTFQTSNSKTGATQSRAGTWNRTGEPTPRTPPLVPTTKCPPLLRQRSEFSREFPNCLARVQTDLEGLGIYSPPA